MLKETLEKFIRRKNSAFRFDKAVSSWVLFLLVKRNFFYFVRGCFFYLVRFRKPSVLLLGRQIEFFNSSNIEFGKWVRIEKGVFLSGLGRGKLSIGNSASIGAYSQVIISTSFNNVGEHIKIGNHVGIGQFASIGGSGGVTIGDNSIIGQYFSCHPENHNYGDKDKLIREQGTTRSEIVIGSNCWIGSKVTVLAGVKIGNGCVIAAGSVVTKDIPENSIAAGIPAKVLKSRI